MSDTAAASPEPGMPRRRRRGSESGAPPEAAALDTAAVSHPGEPDALLAALQHNWRKVASTDNLLLLAEDADTPPPRRAAPARRAAPLLQGLALLLLGGGLIAWAAFALVIARLLPTSRRPAVAALQGDWYYCCLAPLMLPVSFIAITCNWFSLKLFKHNS